MPETKEKDTLEEVAHYYLDTDHLPKRRKELFKQAMLLFVSFSGAGLYMTISNNYANRIRGLYGDDVFAPIHFILGTCLSSLAVLYNSTDIFLTNRDSEVIPPKLSGILDNPFSSEEARCIRDMVIVYFSAISSLPLSMVSMDYPAPWMPSWLIYIQAIVTEVDNTILHFLPIYLALQNPAFRFPVVPFEYGYHYFFDNKTQEDEKNAAEEKAYAVHKKELRDRLDAVQRQLLRDVPLALDVKKFTLDTRLTAILTKSKTRELDLESNASSSTAKLIDMMSYGSLSSLSKSKNTTEQNDILLNIFYVIGAGWVPLSCIGYLAEPINALKKWTNNEIETWLLGVPPLYFFAVLLVYFGGTSMERIYRYIVLTLAEGQLEIPLEFKLYPKSSFLAILLIAYLSVFSFAGANEMIYTNFADKKYDAIRSTLLWFSMSGIIFLSFTASLDFTRTLMNKFALHFGGEEKMVVQINGLIEQMKLGISHVKGKNLMASLENLEDDQLISLGTSRTSLGQTKQKITGLASQYPNADREKASPPRGWCRCLSRFFARFSTKQDAGTRIQSNPIVNGYGYGSFTQPVPRSPKPSLLSSGE